MTTEKNPHLVPLDIAIEDCFSEMTGIESDDPKYDKMTTQLIKLLKLREELTNKQRDYEIKDEELHLKTWETKLKESDAKLKTEEFELKKSESISKPKVSYETLAAIGGNLAGILLILNFEQAGVVASKALGFVSKLK